jgi:hypothetical protein
MGWFGDRNAMCRIYRPIQRLDEGHSFRASSFEATTDEDVPCRLMPVDEATQFVAETTNVVLANLRLPRGQDVDRGYAIVTWKLRTVGGVRETVTARLAASASIGATSLTVDTSVGFEPGDQCVLDTDGQMVRIASAEDDVLGLYADQALEVAAAEDTLVECKTLWLAETTVRPQGWHGPLQVRVRQQPGWWPT